MSRRKDIQDTESMDQILKKDRTVYKRCKCGKIIRNGHLSKKSRPSPTYSNDSCSIPSTTASNNIKSRSAGNVSENPKSRTSRCQHKHYYWKTADTKRRSPIDDDSKSSLFSKFTDSSPDPSELFAKKYENIVLHYFKKLKDYWLNSSVDNQHPIKGGRDSTRVTFVKNNEPKKPSQRQVKEPIPEKFTSRNDDILDKRRNNIDVRYAICRDNNLVPSAKSRSDYCITGKKRAFDIVSNGIEYGLAKGILNRHGDFYYFNDSLLPNPKKKGLRSSKITQEEGGPSRSLVRREKIKVVQRKAQNRTRQASLGRPKVLPSVLQMNNYRQRRCPSKNVKNSGRKRQARSETDESRADSTVHVPKKLRRSSRKQT